MATSEEIQWPPTGRFSWPPSAANGDFVVEAQALASSQQKRLQMVYAMQKMIYDARPYIILSYDDQLNAWSTSWTGFVESNQGFFNAFSTQSLLSVHQA